MSDTEGYIPTDDGLKLYYRLLGEGRDTLVIPTACLLQEDLHRLAKGRRLLFYDRRGRGQSDRDPNAENIWTDYELRDLETVRQHFGLEQMALLGWSVVGAIAALYAATRPERVQRLVLMCPMAPRSPAPYDDRVAVEAREAERIDPAAAHRLREMMGSREHIERAEWFCREFQRVIVPRQMGRPEALARMKSDPCAYSNEWWHNLHQHHQMHYPPETRSNYDWRERVSQVSAPALVVHGIEDLIPLQASREWVAALPQARLWVVEGSGHFPHLETPEVFFPALECFLAGEWPEGAEGDA